MPSVQGGSVRKRPSGRWEARWYDDQGVRHTAGGFDTKTDAWDHLESKRRHPPPTRQMPTLGELADEFTGQHVAEPSTIASLEFRIGQPACPSSFGPSSAYRDPQVAAAGLALRGAGEAARREPAAAVPNPEPKRSEVPTFTLGELEAVSAELAAPTSPSRCSPP